MAAIAIKEEAPDTYFPKTPSKGGVCDKIKINEEKTKTALKVANYVNRLTSQHLKGNGRTTAASSKTQSNGLLKSFEDTMVSHKPPVSETHTALGNSSRCGEIFVTNNAKKWTFVCTFCQKSTRDIGEFVCHIKFKHMNCPYYDDDEDQTCGNDNTANDYDGQREQLTDNSGMEESCNQGQDYIDCTNYLDVNVHTEDSDEMPPFKSETPSLFKPLVPAKEPKLERRPNKKDNDVVSLLDDDDDDDDDDDYEDDNNDTSKNPADDEPMYFDYDFDAPDDEDGIQVIDDNDDDADRMDDDSNQLLLRRSSTDGGDSNNTMSFDFDGDTKRYRSHVRGTAYCELCDKTFQYYSLYRNHMTKHSNVTPFKCQFCDKGFKSKQAIRYHMKTHTKEKPYSCPVCATTYATSNLFMSHVMAHEGENCFPCMVCTKILKTEREREIHLDGHSQERPYNCSFCSKRFRQKHHLSNHLKLHCQYRCDFCKESFNSTQTQRRPYACQTCEEMPDIRQQVERQRSYTLKNQDGPSLMKFENVMLQATGTTVAPTTTNASPEVAVEVATDEEESEESNSLLASTGRKKFPQCKYCRTSYTHVGALNFHLRQKHPEHFT